MLHYCWLPQQVFVIDGQTLPNHLQLHFTVRWVLGVNGNFFSISVRTRIRKTESKKIGNETESGQVLHYCRLPKQAFVIDGPRLPNHLQLHFKVGLELGMMLTATLRLSGYEIIKKTEPANC